MESRAIAAALEQEFPSPPLHLDSPILPKVEALMPQILLPLTPIAIPRVPRDILNERSIYYFNKTRAERFGMPLDEFEKSEKGGEKAWENAAPNLSQLARVLKENGGPFFLGKTVSYADFIVVGFFQFLKCLSYDGDVFDRAMQIDPSFPVLYEACAEWLKRDDY
jgi:glutathione S-transferase